MHKPAYRKNLSENCYRTDTFDPFRFLSSLGPFLFFALFIIAHSRLYVCRCHAWFACTVYWELWTNQIKVLATTQDLIQHRFTSSVARLRDCFIRIIMSLPLCWVRFPAIIKHAKHVLSVIFNFFPPRKCCIIKFFRGKKKSWIYWFSIALRGFVNAAEENRMNFLSLLCIIIMQTAKKHSITFSALFSRFRVGDDI